MKTFAAVVILTCVGLAVLAEVNRREAVRRDRRHEGARLTEPESALLVEVRRLHAKLGSQVWPGFADARVPIVLFNDAYEFLADAVDPPTPWEIVPDHRLDGSVYYRRAVGNPQGFAVRIGDLWAGSLSTLARVNRDFFLAVRRDLPPVLAQVYPYAWATVAPDLHVVALLHEMFHAHQASTTPERFAAAGALYEVEKRYPFADAAFSDEWDAEGAALAAALRSLDIGETRELVRTFLSRRGARRSRAGLDAKLLAFERELEWLEGLGKYVETRFHELAAA
ncbi:MAG: hypothetical protein V3V49_11680, partial [Candidatus Krumholzibacteria bacterium]